MRKTIGAKEDMRIDILGNKIQLSKEEVIAAATKIFEDFIADLEEADLEKFYIYSTDLEMEATIEERDSEYKRRKKLIDERKAQTNV